VVAPSVTEKQLSLTTAEAPAGLVVDGDAGQLERAVINLLFNAVKFTPADGQVTVTTAAEGESAVITVSDTGIGIPETDQPGLFSRFFRASNAVDKRIPGTGLGLAIVSTIVDNHGGTVAVESQEGAGTTFTIRLPLRPPTAA
jgi:two-component system, OmpR family, phosphate regulon sensor histidine kinase PhoR